MQNCPLQSLSLLTFVLATFVTACHCQDLPPPGYYEPHDPPPPGFFEQQDPPPPEYFEQQDSPPPGPPPPGPPPPNRPGGFDDDNSYEDETSSEENRICPRGEYYHVLTDQCYKSGKKGPCPETMQFRKDTKDKGTDGVKYGKDELGRCDCSAKPKGDACTRPLIYSRTFDRCYYIFSQGPCERGQWFVPEIEVSDPSEFPIVGTCRKAGCTEFNTNGTGVSTGDISSGEFMYEWLGRCYQTFTRAHCDSSYTAIFLRHGDSTPRCVPEGWFEKFYPACKKENRLKAKSLSEVIPQFPVDTEKLLSPKIV